MLAKRSALSFLKAFRPHPASTRRLSGISSVYPWRVGQEVVSWADKPQGDAVLEFVSSSSALCERFGPAFAADFDNSSNGSHHFIHAGDKRSLIVKLNETEPNISDVRSGVAAAVGVARKTKAISSLSIDLSSSLLSPVMQDAAIQATVLSNYHFSRHSSDAGIKKHRTLPKLVLFLLSSNVGMLFCGQSAWVLQEFVGVTPNDPLVTKLEATLIARNVANERADTMNPQAIEDIARDLAGQHGLKITVISGGELLERGMHLFHAVGQAAQ